MGKMKSENKRKKQIKHKKEEIQIKFKKRVEDVTLDSGLISIIFFHILYIKWFAKKNH